MTSNIDDYLIHEFNILDEEVRIEESISGEAQQENVRLPMLLRVTDTRWRPRRIPDCSVIAQLGNIVACFGSRRTLEALQNDPKVLSIEASRPASSPEHEDSLPPGNANLVERPPVEEKGDKALIAIIDNGIDVLHHAFRDSTGKRTRILALWDQTDQTGPAPNIGQGPKKGTEIGTLYKQEQINRFIANSESLPEGLKKMRQSALHGTHVASIAAGREIKSSGFNGGIAPEAKLIIVVPDPNYKVKEGDPPSLGYSTSHTAALTFIRDFAHERNLPVVVNLSQGMNAGAHDGTSALEAAFDEFTRGGREPGFVVVKSAGNERNNNGHAKFSVKSDQRTTLTWESPDLKDQPPEEHRSQDTIELWFKACDEVAFRLHAPDGEYSRQVTNIEPVKRGHFQESGNGYELSYTRYHLDNGDSRFLVTITASLDDTDILPGKWTLEIECGTIRSSGEVHAWIERQAKRPIRFVNHVNEEMTLSIPGTAHTVICVSAVSATRPYEIPLYSSYGPTRDEREKPELCAPGEKITAARSNSLTDLTTKRGTSMAAPHVTGAIALLFSYWEKKIGTNKKKRLNAAQVRSAISQTTRNFNSHWSNDMGYGVLNIEGLLKAFQ